jgi:hypothetical protein
MTESPSATAREATITRVFDANVEVLTTTVTDLGDGKTERTYHQVGHLPQEQYPQIEEGVAGFYERLVEHLAEC